jgi:G3E family GTPase
MSMDQTRVVAVVGACSQTRHRLAREIAWSMNQVLVPAQRLASAPVPAQEVLTPSSPGVAATGAVVEVPTSGHAADFITALVDGEGGLRLGEVVCVIDAGAGLDELFREGAHPRRTAGGCAALPRPLTVMAQLEMASTLMIVNWEGLSTDELQTVLALVHHLCPLGDFRFQEFESMEPSTAVAYDVEALRPGWAHLLGGTFEPLVTHPRIDAFRYECVRPFHLGRLRSLIHELTGSRRFGTLIRSAGYCRTAPDANVTEIWNQVGPALYSTPVAVDEDLDHVLDAWADAQPMALGQDLAFIGLDLEREALMAALDATVLTDAEFMAGPAAWKKQLKPFL